MTDYSDDITKLLFDLESQQEQTKIDIKTSKKRSSEFSGFMEAFGTDGETLSEKWEREEVEENEYQEQVASERAEEQVRLEEERIAEETGIKKERQRQLKAKKNATASEVKSLKEKWKREDVETKLEQQRQIEEAEYNLHVLREEQKGESEKQADAFENFLSILTGEAEQVREEIEEIMVEADVQHIHEYSVSNTLSELGATENLITDSVKAINKLKREEMREELSSDTDIAQLAGRLDLLQKNLNELTSIGWGQRGMTYGSGEVRLENLDDVETTAKTDGYYLKYQTSTDSWIGSVSTTGGWDPSGYEYTGDKTLETIVNEDGAVYGLEIEEDTWTVMSCTGAVGPTPGSEDNMLPSSFSSRIWDRSSNRFSFAEVPVDGVILFRVQAWIYPETNNALITGRIRFVAIRDGTEHVLNEDGDRIVLEDDSGNITGDYFQAYSFFQTVSAQEMADGAGVEHERTFIFPIYVGNSHAQRGFGQFELNCSCDFTLNDSSVVAVLN